MNDFSDSEIGRIQELLAGQYHRDVELQLAECDLDVGGEDDGSATCATVVWYAGGANFAVYKTGPQRYRSRFFYTPHEQFPTGISEFNDLDQCVLALLQAQSDHERETGSPS